MVKDKSLSKNTNWSIGDLEWKDGPDTKVGRETK